MKCREKPWWRGLRELNLWNLWNLIFRNLSETWTKVVIILFFRSFLWVYPSPWCSSFWLCRVRKPKLLGLNITFYILVIPWLHWGWWGFRPWSRTGWCIQENAMHCWCFDQMELQFWWHVYRYIYIYISCMTKLHELKIYRYTWAYMSLKLTKLYIYIRA